MMSLFNKSQTETAASGLTSDQAALERAGKKQVLKVQLRLDICYLQLADYHTERMELPGGAWLLQRDLGYLGGYERSIFCCLHQWRSGVRCLWLHRLRTGHCYDRRFHG